MTRKQNWIYSGRPVWADWVSTTCWSPVCSISSFSLCWDCQRAPAPVILSSTVWAHVTVFLILYSNISSWLDVQLEAASELTRTLHTSCICRRPDVEKSDVVIGLVRLHSGHQVKNSHWAPFQLFFVPPSLNCILLMYLMNWKGGLKGLRSENWISKQDPVSCQLTMFFCSSKRADLLPDTELMWLQ